MRIKNLAVLFALILPALLARNAAAGPTASLSYAGNSVDFSLGQLILGSGIANCGAATTGAIRYNSATPRIEYCNGASWQAPSATPAGANGQIQFNSNGSAFGASSGLFWDDANKRLGIGTTSPTTKLQVVGGDIKIDVNQRLQSDSMNGTNSFIPNQGSSALLSIGAGGSFTLIDGGGNIKANIAVGSGNTYFMTGNIGISTSSPKATLDVNGYVRLTKNAAQPVACAAANDGAIALTSGYTLCVCKGGSASWVKESDGSTACSW